VQLVLSLVEQRAICDASSASISLAAGQVLPFTTNKGAVYDSSVNCISTITAPVGYAVAVFSEVYPFGVTTTSINLESGADFLYFYDGVSTAYPQLLTPLTGGTLGFSRWGDWASGAQLPGMAASSGNSLTLQFTSSVNVSLSGAHIVLLAVKQRDMCADQSAITLGTPTLVTDRQSVQCFFTGPVMLVPISTNYNSSTYKANSTCTVSVTAPAPLIPNTHLIKYAVDALTQFQVFNGVGTSGGLLVSGTSMQPPNVIANLWGGSLTLRFSSPASALAKVCKGKFSAE
jgi:hypothetical protein